MAKKISYVTSLFFPKEETPMKRLIALMMTLIMALSLAVTAQG